MRLNGKEMKNIQNKWMRNGEITISLFIKDALYIQDYNT